MAWGGRTSKTREGAPGTLAVEVLVGPVSPASVLTRFLLPLQRTPKCQNLPQSPQPCLPGLSHPRAWRDCNQQDLSPGAWSGLRSRTALGRRPASTTPMRSPGSLLSPVVSPGQCEEEQRLGAVGTALVAQAGQTKRGKVEEIPLFCCVREEWVLVASRGAGSLHH